MMSKQQTVTSSVDYHSRVTSRQLTGHMDIYVTLVVHAVHDGHQLLQSCHRLLFISFTHEVGAKTRNHPLNASQTDRQIICYICSILQKGR